MGDVRPQIMNSQIYWCDYF